MINVLVIAGVAVLGIIALDSAYSALQESEWTASKRRFICAIWFMASMACANYVALAIF